MVYFKMQSFKLRAFSVKTNILKQGFNNLLTSHKAQLFVK
jgi:hypothetical protein